MTAEEVWPNDFSIATGKITAYLLNPSHKEGGGKCMFLAQFGYRPDTADVLEYALYQHARLENFASVKPAYQAIKIYFEGPLLSQTDAAPNVRTVWQVDDDDPSRTARFITLKPLPKIRAN